MKIYIHVGVHKTATTYTQNVLHHNREALHASGIGYISLWDFRAFFTEKFMEFTPETFKIEDHLPKFFGNKKPGNVKGLLISEENLVGYCGGLLASGSPFGSARGRLSHLAALLANHEITMFCSVREYGSFLSSAYCEGIRNTQQYVPFEDYRNRLQWGKIQWPYLIDGFEKSLNPVRTVLWRFEDFRKNSAIVLNALTFNAGIKMSLPTGRSLEYPSFSKTTVDTLEVVAKNLGTETANKLIDSVAEAFPKGEQYPAHNPWTPGETALLKKMYASDCESIDATKWLIDETPKPTLAAPVAVA